MREIKLFTIFFLVIWILLGTFSSALAFSISNSSHGSKIILKSRQFTPSVKKDISRFNDTHFLLQLDHFPTEDERKILDEVGIKLLSYIPEKAWFVSLSKEISPEDVVNLMPSVTWIGDILPEDKISPHIINNQLSPEVFDEQGNIYLTVQFHGDVMKENVCISARKKR